MSCRTLSLLLALCALGACDAVPGGGDVVCVSGGVTYRPGDSFPSPDGCNQCGCGEGGQVACTARACAPTCSYDGNIYMEGQSFPSTDGCNTCSCGAGGQVACTKRACAPGAWLSLLPRQCQGNPWQQVSSKGDGTAPAYADAELLAIDNYFEDQGIDLMELGLLQPGETDGTCGACNCARGDRLVVRASATQAAELTAKHGFTAVAATDALTLSPKLCNNPWTTSQVPKDEAKNALTWLKSSGAAVGHTGLVYRTATVAGCEACNCARGDRLLSYPKGDAAVTKLKELGFTALPQ